MATKEKTPTSAATLTGVRAETVACGATISYDYFTMGGAGPSTISVGGGVDG